MSSIIAGDEVVMTSNRIGVLDRGGQPVIYDLNLNPLKHIQDWDAQIVSGSTTLLFYDNQRVFGESEKPLFDLGGRYTYGQVCKSGGTLHHFVFKYVYTEPDTMRPPAEILLYHLTSLNHHPVRLDATGEIRVFCGLKDIYLTEETSKKQRSLYRLVKDQLVRVTSPILGPEDGVFMLNQLVVQKKGVVQDLQGYQIWDFGLTCNHLKQKGSLLACANDQKLQVVNLANGKHWHKRFEEGISGIALGQFLVVKSAELHLLSLQGETIKSVAYGN